MSNDSFCKLAQTSGEFLEDVSIALNVNKGEALNIVGDFFQNRTMPVQQKVIQGAFYRLGSWTQAGGSGVVVYKTIIMAKLAGVQDVALI